MLFSSRIMTERAFSAPGASSASFAAPGPHRASQLRDGDPFELSDGHRIACLPAGSRHANANILGGAVLASDPATQGRVGADLGVAFNEDKNLRAPDLAIGVETGFGWQTTVPPLVVEYASVGQDMAALEQKIAELLAAGTRIVWVIHLVGPLRADIHEQGAAVRTVGADAELVAPGLLENPVTVRALAEPDAALAAVLRNFLQPFGARTIEELRASSKDEGKLEGRLEGKLEERIEVLLESLAEQGLAPSEDELATIRGCRDLARLRRWSVAVRRAASVADVLGS